MEIAVPELVDGVSDEFCGGSLGGLVGGVVMKQNGMVGFVSGADDGGGIIGDGRIGRGACRDGEFSASGGIIRRGWLDDADEIMFAVFIVGYVEE